MSTALAKQTTVRLPTALYQQAKEIAKEAQISVNQLIQQSLKARAEEVMAAKMKQAYEILGQEESRKT